MMTKGDQDDWRGDEHAEITEKMLAAWKDDWGIHVDELCKATGLSQTGALLYLAVMRLHAVTVTHARLLDRVTRWLNDMQEHAKRHEEMMDKVEAEMDSDDKWKKENGVL